MLEIQFFMIWVYSVYFVFVQCFAHVYIITDG